MSESPGFDLGKFILDGIPYRYDEKDESDEPKLIMASSIANATEVGRKTDGPAKDFGEDEGKKLAVSEDEAARDPKLRDARHSEDYIRAHPWESNWFYFKGVAHRVVKTVRIGYTAMQDGKPIERHILIGYEGVDGMG